MSNPLVADTRKGRRKVFTYSRSEEMTDTAPSTTVSKDGKRQVFKYSRMEETDSIPRATLSIDGECPISTSSIQREKIDNLKVLKPKDEKRNIFLHGKQDIPDDRDNKSQAQKKSPSDIAAERIHARRGPAPAIFAEAMDCPGIQQKLDEVYDNPPQKRPWPYFDVELEAMLPECLRNIPPPGYLVRRQKESEAQIAKEEANHTERLTHQRARFALKEQDEEQGFTNKEEQEKSKESELRKPKSKKTQEEQKKQDKAELGAKLNTLTKNFPGRHEQMRTKAPVLPQAVELDLIIDPSNSKGQGISLRIYRPRAFTDKGLKSGGFDTQLARWQPIITDFMVQEIEGVVDEMKAYRCQNHGGSPVELTDYDSLHIDMLSEFSYIPEKPTPVEIGRWEWFNKHPESCRSADEDEHPVDNLDWEIRSCDAICAPIPPDVPSREVWAKQQFLSNGNGEKKIQRVKAWLDNLMYTARMRPYTVDTSSEGFRNGEDHTCGMRRHYVEHPGDALFPFTRPNFGPIDWDNIPTHYPQDGFSQAPYRRHQTAEYFVRAGNLEYQEKQKRAKQATKQQAKAAVVARKEWDKAHKNSFDPNRAFRKNNDKWLPKLNIYVRPAKSEDMASIAELHNAWISNSVQAVNFDYQKASFWEDIFRDSVDKQLPFLVAVTKCRKWSRNAQDNIVGFSFIEPYGIKGTSLQHTVELQVWVSQDRPHHGVGKTLVDRMLPCLDSQYKTHSGTDFLIDNAYERFYRNGGVEEKRKIVATLFYETGDDLVYQWQKQWLEDTWGFYMCAYYRDGACKFSKSVNMVVMMRDCKSRVKQTSSIFIEEDNGIGYMIGV